MIFSKQSATDADLVQALADCKTFAKRGHALATDAVSLLNRVTKTVSDEVQENITNLTKSNFHDTATSKRLAAQLSSIRSNFEFLPLQLHDDINAISKTSFSITLFGRTNAGKSTLMEILTHGNGVSIGIGAQRTTRDVRTYTYRGLKITDVPGIGAFEGKEDEDVAFEAAKKGDLIIFLITSDEPQACEAECMKRILSLGKPVICLLNVLADINSPANLKMFKHDIQKKMSTENLDAIKKQFFEFGTRYGQNWHIIRIAYVHLKATFLSQQSEFKNVREELYGLSCFDYVENLIVSEVSKNGSFYKLKAFSDIVAVPVVDALETLFSQSAQNSKQGSILIGKKRKLQKWTDEFKADGERRIKTLLSVISGELKREVASFAEDNYDNSNASDEWSRILKNRDIERLASKLLQQLSKECENELCEISREIDSEINFSYKMFSDSSMNMPRLHDGKRIWNWATSLTSGGLLIAGLYYASNPIGWIALGVGLVGWLGSFLFDDHEKKVRNARQKLEMKLSIHIDKMIADLEKNLLGILSNDLLEKQLYPMSAKIDEVTNSVFMLSKIQQEFATTLNGKLKEINTAIVKEALVYLGFSGLEWHITSIARIPGSAIMIVLEDGKRFPEDAVRALRLLLKESVWFVFNTNNIKSMLSQTIGRGCDRSSISIQYIDNIPRIAHIPSVDALDANTNNRIRLAQQITELLIMKQNGGNNCEPTK